MLWEECEEVVQDAWNRLDGGNTGLTKIKDRIASCGRDLHAWGSIRTHPDKDKIKQLQKKVEAISMGELTEGNRSEFVTASKELDSLLLRDRKSVV